MESLLRVFKEVDVCKISNKVTRNFHIIFIGVLLLREQNGVSLSIVIIVLESFNLFRGLSFIKERRLHFCSVLLTVVNKSCKSLVVQLSSIAKGYLLKQTCSNRLSSFKVQLPHNAGWELHFTAAKL